MLLDLGTAAASEIPALSRVPRTRVYATIQQLHAKGLVQILPEKPVRYRAVPFPKYLRNLAAEYTQRASHLSENAEELSREFKASAIQVPDRPGHFEVIYGRKNVRNRVLEMYASAEREVIATGSVHSAVRMVRGLGPAMEDLARRGIRISLAYHVSPDNESEVQTMAQYAEVRHFEFLTPVCRHGVDAREFLMSHPIPDDDSSSKGEDIAIWTDDPAIAAALSHMTQRIFETGKPIGVKPRGPRIVARLTAKAAR